jgi:hypothetical protein
MSTTLETIQKAVEKTVGGPVSHAGSRAVIETFQGEVVWRGIVEVFVVFKPPPEKAYGWIADSKDGVDYVAVLGTPPINSPLDAVSAWIVLQGKK